MIKKTFYIGLNDKNTLKQEIASDEAVKIIKQVLYAHDFNYMTLSRANGVYVMNDSGESSDENTIVVTICESIRNHLKHRKNARAVIDDLKVLLNQESIGYEINYAIANF
jgi:hypothetical protein